MYNLQAGMAWMVLMCRVKGPNTILPTPFNNSYIWHIKNKKCSPCRLFNASNFHCLANVTFIGSNRIQQKQQSDKSITINRHFHMWPDLQKCTYCLRCVVYCSYCYVFVAVSDFVTFVMDPKGSSKMAIKNLANLSLPSSTSNQT